MSGHQVASLMKHVDKVRDMLHVQTSGWMEDLYESIDGILNIQLYKNEHDELKPLLRYPLLSYLLLRYREKSLTLREDFAEECERRIPGATEMLQLAETVYAFLNSNWFRETFRWCADFNEFNETRERWELEDLSDSRLSVDGSCVQFMADLLEHPGCPLEDTPKENLQRRETCRQQLGRDLMLNLSYIPVTSYLAYTQRVNIDICLLSWMVISSKTICQDVPPRMLKSVSEARCLFSHSEGKPCRPNNTADFVCYVSRAVFFFKCMKFYEDSFQLYCIYDFELRDTGTSAIPDRLSYGKENVGTIFSAREDFKKTTLKYRDFKIDHLHSLEVSLISINLLFRCLTASVFLYLPKFRNLPGKLLLCFQMTGIAQILCSEVAYRMYGVPELATTVQLDSALTLLTCVWLNAFCHQLFSGIRHLRLPDALDPREATRLFRNYAKCALVVWAVVSSIFISLERVSQRYLFHSRTLLLTAIALSVAGNVLLLVVIAFTYIRTQHSMSKLSITTDNKRGSRTQQIFLSMKTFLLSGLGIMVRLGFHQAEGVAWLVYCVHLATMLQGPVIFVLFVCNGTALPQLKRRALRRWRSDVIISEENLCSTARKNLDKCGQKTEPNILETVV